MASEGEGEGESEREPGDTFIIDVICTIIQCVTSGYMREVKSSDVLVDYHLTNRLNSVHHYMYI